MRQSDLEAILNEIYRKYHDKAYLYLDPVEFVHGVSGDRNREIAGLLCSALAYGRIEQIRKSIETIFEITGNDLLAFTNSTSFAGKKKLFASFKHRFNAGMDIALLFESIRIVLDKNKSVEEVFCNGLHETDITVTNALDAFANTMRSTASSVAKCEIKTFDFLFPKPCDGSSCKRLNMYLRWMARPADGIDFGIWKRVGTARLVVPVDTHVAHIAQRLLLTKRKTPDWAMALEITSALRKICPADPVRYDFSLCHSGMVDFRTMHKAA